MTITFHPGEHELRQRIHASNAQIQPFSWTVEELAALASVLEGILVGRVAAAPTAEVIDLANRRGGREDEQP
jgi:hypothetical protein